MVADFRDSFVEEAEEAMTVTPSLERITKTIDQVLSNMVDVVGSFRQIFSSSDMEMYVMPDGADDEAELWEKVDLGVSIRSNQLFVNAKDMVHRHIRQAFYAVKDYTYMFEPYRQLYSDNMQDSSDVAVIFESGEIDAFVEAIAAYRAQIDQFKEVPRFADVGVFFVDSDEMKAKMIPSPLACLQAIKKFLPELCGLRAQELLDTIGAMNPIIASEPNSVESYVNKKKVKDAAALGLDEYKERQSYLKSLVNVLEDNSWTVPDDVKAVMRMLNEGLTALGNNIELADGKEEEEVKKFSSQVNEEVPKALKKIAECREQLDTGFLGDPDTSDEKVLKYLTQVEVDFEKAKSRTQKLQEYQVRKK